MAYNKKSNLTIYLCSHKPFKPIPETEAHPERYRIITNCTDPFPPTKLDIVRVNDKKYECNYGEDLQNSLNEWRYIDCISMNEPLLNKYIGINHYRRYFDTSVVDRLDLDLIFEECKIPILLGTPVVFSNFNIGEHDNESWFGYWHSYTCWKEFEKYFKEIHPNLTKEFDEMAQADFLHNSAMSIMPRDLFIDMCDFVLGTFDQLQDKFGIHNEQEALAYVDKHIEEWVRPYRPYYTREISARVLGFLIERITGVWLRIKRENGKSLIEEAGELQWFMPDPKTITA